MGPILDPHGVGAGLVGETTWSKFNSVVRAIED